MIHVILLRDIYHYPYILDLCSPHIIDLIMGKERSLRMLNLLSSVAFSVMLPVESTSTTPPIAAYPYLSLGRGVRDYLS